MIDRSNVGLWGHSWGGYQTAFLATQTSIFKAAIAGAPLTNMVSIPSVYWNTGNLTRRSSRTARGASRGTSPRTPRPTFATPVFHAERVKTPLIILADDKDGAVDFNQGITITTPLRSLRRT